jgi:hypothetical protein
MPGLLLMPKGVNFSHHNLLLFRPGPWSGAFCSLLLPQKSQFVGFLTVLKF